MDLELLEDVGVLKAQVGSLSETTKAEFTNE